MMSGENQNSNARVFISRHLFEELIKICLDALPGKAYGLVGGADMYHPASLYPCSTNLRNTLEWNKVFESYGEFYLNPDLGFVISPIEVRQVMSMMEARRESFIGVFHSHRFLPLEPSAIDIGLSSDPGLFCYIVSVIQPYAPQVGIFRLDGGGFQSIPIVKR